MDTGSLVIVGQFGAPHGIRGWVKLNSFTEPDSNILEYADWFVGKEGHWALKKCVARDARGTKLVVQMEGFKQREEAQQLTGQWVAVPREALPPAEEGRYYWNDLIGCTVTHVDGHVLGVVDHLLDTGANDVMVIKHETGERLIPFLKDDVVTQVKLSERNITVRWDDI